MNSSEYWEKREAEALKHRITDEEEYDRRIKAIYSDMLSSCTREINAFYGKYADKEGITLAEAKKRVKELDIKEYERKAAKYVKDKDFSNKANEEMRLYNATMKINRLEMLKANIGLEMIAGHNELEKFMGGILKGRTEDELKRQAGILGETVKSNAKKANAIINASFHNADFSGRIWLYQDLLKADLSNLLAEGLIRGKNPNKLARELRTIFYGGDPEKDGGYLFCAQRLMRTELARVQTDAQKQSFERNGFGKYEFIVNGGCCPICEALSGKRFDVAKMMPGKNAPPMHPFCRCSTAAYSDGQDYTQWLGYLEKGGSTKSYNLLKERAEQIKKDHKKALEIFGNSDIIKLDNKNVRDWYVNSVSAIKDNIPETYTIEEKAIAAFNARDNIRILAREMMQDEERRKQLYNEQPNKSFEELVKSKMSKKQLTREEAIEDVYKTATKTNENVNRLFGVEGG